MLAIYENKFTNNNNHCSLYGENIVESFILYKEKVRFNA